MMNPDELLLGARPQIRKTDEENEIDRMKQRIRDLEEENEFLKKCQHTLRKNRGKACDQSAGSGIIQH